MIRKFLLSLLIFSFLLGVGNSSGIAVFELPMVYSDPPDPADEPESPAPRSASVEGDTEESTRLTGARNETFEKLQAAETALEAARESGNDEEIQKKQTAYNEAKKKYDEAISQYRKAIELKPNNEVYYENIVGAYDKLKQYDKAVENINKALEINPKSFASSSS